LLQDVWDISQALRDGRLTVAGLLSTLWAWLWDWFWHAEIYEALFVLGGTLFFVIMLVVTALDEVDEWRARRREAREATNAGRRKAALGAREPASLPPPASEQKETKKLEAGTGRVSTFGAIVVRFCRVLYVVCFLITLGVVVLMYWPSKHHIENAVVVCADGTSWDATGSGIRFVNTTTDGYKTALCGLCTKRASDGTSYSLCDYSEALRKNAVYRLQEITYVWKPSIKESMTIIAIFAGAVLLVLEVMRMIAAYIFFGNPGEPFWWRWPRCRLIA